MKKVRFAVVGLGHRGRHMARLAADKFEFAEIVAACDIDPLLWEEKQWLQEDALKNIYPDVKFYTQYEEMLEKHAHELDFVFVETGADVHAEFCIKALQKDINVFSDIPSVATLAEAKKLWDAQCASKAKLMTGANTNEWGFINLLVDLYNKGLLGEPYYMEAEYIHASRQPAATNPILIHSPWRKTLPPIRYCTHSLGPLLRIMKEVLRYVVCMGTGVHINKNALKDDMQSALFQTESGVTIRLLRNGACRAFIGHHSYRVFGTKGYFERVAERGKTPSVVRFQSDEFYGARELTDLDVGMMPNEYMDKPDAAGHGGADYALFDHMFKAFLEGAEDFPISLRDGLMMTLPGIYAAKSAALKGEKLTIHYPWEKEFEEDIARIDN
ncbi:MAG: Gfo/Idh/MocA family oxidoreductase [Lentisphaeria bacterium]|nr:Gfo/Idh/MocA family oxidoreductase [Lentisphaeria bacterium]